MIPQALDPAAPSTLAQDAEGASLTLCATSARPVSYRGMVRKQGLYLRLALQALGGVLWSDPAGQRGGSHDLVPDPVLTVHPDALLFEAFGADRSAYALVRIERGVFEEEAEVSCGTTTIDFSPALWSALGDVRSSRRTEVCIHGPLTPNPSPTQGGEGSQSAPSPSPPQWERGPGGEGGRLPLDWVRGFLSLQEAMALPGTRFRARPVDLLAALRYLKWTRAKLSPRALRYEFPPGAEVRLVLEPWEHVIPLKGSRHNYTEERAIRTWGRKRLVLLEDLLPYADRVDVYLKGRALPSFYAVQFPGITFLLGLSGWADQGWTEGNFGLLVTHDIEDRALMEPALEVVRQKVTLTAEDLGIALGLPQETATRVLARLARQGRVLYDLERQQYRHRELFAEPPEEKVLFPPDERRDRAWELLARRQVRVVSCQKKQTRKLRNLPTPDGRVQKEVVYHDWHVAGEAGDQIEVALVINEAGRLIFGTCGCPFFRDNLLNRGPCEHLAALLHASEAARRDRPTANDAPMQQG